DGLPGRRLARARRARRRGGARRGAERAADSEGRDRCGYRRGIGIHHGTAGLASRSERQGVRQRRAAADARPARQTAGPQEDYERDPGAGCARRSEAAADVGRSRDHGGRLPRVLAAAGDAAPSARGAQAGRTDGAARVPQGRSVDPDSPGTQDEHRRGKARSRSRGVRAVESGRVAAPPAHPDLHSEAGESLRVSQPRSPSLWPRSVLFTEPTFLFLFLPTLLALYFAPAVGRGRHRTVHGAYGNWLLLVASVLFYAKGGGAFTWLMLASIAFNYWMAIAVDRSRARSAPAAKRWVAFAVAANLVVLGIFKYANFFADNANTLFLALDIQPVVVPRVLLPIGISFFTFHAISYVIDVYRRDATAQKSPVHAALYLLLFPQLIAGPIIRYRDIADQLASRLVTIDDFGVGVRRFVIGLAKKVLVANIVAAPADQIFALPPPQISTAHAWLAIVCYTFQIYFDFSGYSDMAIGLGRMFGFRFPENFRWPYVATSVQGFWRRWHLSLSTWFRDYLYIPLGGNRVSLGRQY